MLRAAHILEQGARAVVTERHIRTKVSELRKHALMLEQKPWATLYSFVVIWVQKSQI
jgi:hypothetical protein